MSNNIRYRRQNRSRGFFLVKVFFAVLIFFTMSAAISAMLTVQPHLAVHRENRLHAQLAAESVLNETIVRLLKDKDHQQDGHFEVEGLEETALVTFDPANPYYCVNNSRGAVALEGSNGPVLPNTAHLVAVGECRGTRYVAEAVVVFQRFPYALASTGRIVSEGKLEVFGVDTFADAEGGVTLEERKPGHIVSNLAEPDAVTLNPLALIEGDVRSSGGVLQNGAVIKGSVKTAQSAADLPTLRIEEYDPRRFSDDYTAEVSPGALAGQAEVTVANQRLRVNANGGEVVIHDGLSLDDGLLYVEGDLVIRGGVKGKGALVATGKITIIGQSSLDGDMTALVSGGGVNIDGQGLGISSFRGMVATLGDFQADSTSVMGAYLALGKDPTTQIGTSTMTLRDVQSVHAPDVTKIDIVGHVKLQEMLHGGAGNSRNSSEIGLLMPNGTFYTFTGKPKQSGESQASYEARRDTEIAASYEALKGPTDGSPYVMAEGRVIVRRSDGSEVAERDLGYAAKRTRDSMAHEWGLYLATVASGTVKIVPIFSIDLNQFTSGHNRIKILTYGERVSEH